MHDCIKLWIEGIVIWASLLMGAVFMFRVKALPITKRVRVEPMKNGWLVAAGLLSAAASLLHVATIIGGPDWYRFFGAGEDMARAAERGSLMPSLVTAAIATILAIWALYAFSAAGLVRRLPLIRTALVLITGVYMLRGLALIPLLALKPQLVDTFAIVSFLIVLGYGVTYAVGAWLAKLSMAANSASLASRSRP